MINHSELPVRVRFAPSPTGFLHLGSARTALYDYLLAKKTRGQFILRIEDTDRHRFTPEGESDIMASLQWLGLEWDEGPDKGGPAGPYRQSERKAVYLQHAHELIKNGHAYYCFCSSDRLEQVRKEQQSRKQITHYDGTCRNLSLQDSQKRVDSGESHVVRFKMPKEGRITAHDQIRGDISVENHTLDDAIIVRSDGLALYHLASMVDDQLMGITHVIRGSEWLPSFPLHVHIYRAFSWVEPVWIHLSVFLKPSGKGKMSKRESADLMKSGKSIFVNQLEKLGYLPEAVNNWVALMGWSYDDHTEFFHMEDLINKFSIDRLNPSPAAINFSKLDHFNGLHIRNLPISELKVRIRPFLNLEANAEVDDKLSKIVPIIQERMVTLDDSAEMAGFFFQSDIYPAMEGLIGKNMDAYESLKALKRIYQVLQKYPSLSVDTVEQPLRDIAEEMGLKAGQLFGLLRMAVTGQRVSPPLLESMQIIGYQQVLSRIQNAIDRLVTVST